MEDVKIHFSLTGTSGNFSFAHINEITDIETITLLKEQFMTLEQKLKQHAVGYYLEKSLGNELAKKINIIFQPKREPTIYWLGSLFFVILFTIVNNYL